MSSPGLPLNPRTDISVINAILTTRIFPDTPSASKSDLRSLTINDTQTEITPNAVSTTSLRTMDID